MLSHESRPRARADADAMRARIARRLQRYAPAVQAAVQETARGRPRVADLALSFPALLFALAVPRREADAARALEAAGVPMWLRRLPVEALTKPLPHLPDGDLFRRRIVDRLPRSPKLAPVWLETVAFAAQWAHEPLAIWIAREAARKWLHRHHLPAIDPKRPRWGTVPLVTAAWRLLWRPYWLAKRRLPTWLPLGPSRDALEML